jgi:hypothetical protein
LPARYRNAMYRFITGLLVGNRDPMSPDENLKNLHKALLNFNKRAERASSEILVSNFVDSEPLFDLLSTPNIRLYTGGAAQEKHTL